MEWNLPKENCQDYIELQIKDGHRENWVNLNAGLSGNTQIILGRICNERGTIVAPGSVYSAVERISLMEYMAEEYIKKYPRKAFKECPVLKLAFRSNGSKRSTTELLENMLSMVENESSLAKSEVIESLYLTIIANRYPDSFDREYSEVDSFIRNRKMKKNFVERLEKAIYGLKGHDIQKRAVLRDFRHYGVGMSRSAKYRRNEYFKDTLATKSRARARQYFVDPQVEQEDTISKRYKIDVPVVNNRENDISRAIESSKDISKTTNESENNR